eukprot:692576-Prorocentrum_minimum.AAC.1
MRDYRSPAEGRSVRSIALSAVRCGAFTAVFEVPLLSFWEVQRDAQAFDNSNVGACLYSDRACREELNRTRFWGSHPTATPVYVPLIGQMANSTFSYHTS